VVRDSFVAAGATIAANPVLRARFEVEGDVVGDPGSRQTRRVRGRRVDPEHHPGSVKSGRTNNDVKRDEGITTPDPGNNDTLPDGHKTQHPRAARIGL